MKLLLENWREYIKEAQEISIEIEGATIDGVVHDNPERLMNLSNIQGVS